MILTAPKDKGADRDMYSQKFDAAAVEMRALCRQLTSDQLAGATASAQQVLTFLDSRPEVSGCELLGTCPAQ